MAQIAAHSRTSETFHHSYRLIRFLLAGVFIWSGTAKLFDPRGFALIIDAYGLLPGSFIYPTALALSIAELMAGIGLLFDVQWSLEILTGLLLLFMVVLGYGLWLGLDVDCGCFSADDPEGQAYHGLRPALYRDMIMLMGMAYLYVWRRRHALRPIGIKGLWISAMHKGGDTTTPDAGGDRPCPYESDPAAN